VQYVSIRPQIALPAELRMPELHDRFAYSARAGPDRRVPMTALAHVDEETLDGASRIWAISWQTPQHGDVLRPTSWGLGGAPYRLCASSPPSDCLPRRRLKIAGVTECHEIWRHLLGWMPT
jgi:hypothetical protein